MEILNIIFGGAGFIGSNLSLALSSMHESVIIVDNLSRGSEKNIKYVYGKAIPNFFQVECGDYSELLRFFDKTDFNYSEINVWHLIANSDILAGVENADIDFKDTFLTTHNILKLCEKFNFRNFYFASTSAVYGDQGSGLITENVGSMNPISNYGAMKLASEAIISSASEKFLKKSLIFRFPNVVGAPATHGIILDLINKLKINSESLNVLGDGSQQKAYLHVTDLVSAMLHLRKFSDRKFDVYNIGPLDDGVTVSWIAHRLVEILSPETSLVFGIESRGWVGDVPKFFYSIEKLISTGWKPSLTSEESILKSIAEIRQQLA